MSDLDVFVIDDDFDPLADLELAGEDEQPETDYLPPIPDAELSRVPERVELPAAVRIDKLLKGIPGQQFRILRAVECCADEPKDMDTVVADVEAAYPTKTSVYDVPQIVQLLVRAGALERLGAEADASVEGEPVSGDTGAQGTAFESATAADDYIVVTPAPPSLYRATREGLDAVAARKSEKLIVQTITEEERYLPLYERIFELAGREGGCPTKELDQAIDHDPLCEEPRRFCGYFLGRLEETGAVCWRDAWVVTDLGRAVLESGVFEAKRS